MLAKGQRTVENQLYTVYQKMVDLCDTTEMATRKRQVLLDILAGRV